MLFDIVNSHSRYGKQFKAPISKDNLVERKAKLSQLLNYLDSLTLMDGRPLSDSSRKTFILGFKLAARNIISIAEDTLLDETSGIQYILGYKLSQDHVETLFSKIRAKGGFNNNPNVIQFKAALKSLLVKTDISSSPHANCLDFEEDSSFVTFRSKSRVKPGEDDILDLDVHTLEDTSDAIDSTSIELTSSIKHIVEYIGKYFAALKLLKIDNFMRMY